MKILIISLPRTGSTSLLNKYSLEYNLKKSDNIEIYVTEEVLKSIDKDTYNRCNEHFEKIIEDKLFLIKKIFNYCKSISYQILILK